MGKLSRRLALLLASSLTTAGCVSMRPAMTSFSVDYNRVVADTRNRMILLNIVRAAYREPTYYTAFDHIEGSLNLQASVSGEIANLIGGDATAFKPTVSGSITNAPTFSIIPLNGDDFAKGMLQPVRPDTIQLFLSQGWRSRLLAPLLVQKVECIYDDEVVAEIENQPGHQIEGASSESFEEIAFYTGKAEPGAAYKFTLPAADALKALTGGVLDKFDVAQGSQPADPILTTVAVTAQPDRPLAVRIPDTMKAICKARVTDAIRHREDVRRRPTLSAEEIANLAVSDIVSAGGTRILAAKKSGITINVVFRSTDAIVYYLGELIRVKFTGHPPKPNIGEDTLFDLDRDGHGPAAVAITHRGATWSIPARELADLAASTTHGQDRSLQVIALLNQLIAAQTSSKEFSRAPSSVRVR